MHRRVGGVLIREDASNVADNVTGCALRSLTLPVNLRTPMVLWPERSTARRALSDTLDLVEKPMRVCWKLYGSSAESWL